MINLWERTLTSHDETGPDQLMRIRFISERHQSECLTFNKTFYLRTSLLTVADCIAKVLTNPVMTSAYSSQIVIQSDEALVFVGTNRRDNTDYSIDQPSAAAEQDTVTDFIYTAPQRNLTILIEITSNRHIVTKIFTLLDNSFKKEKQAQVKWWYKGDHGSVTYKNIYLPPLKTKLLPEFYPDLDQGPKTFMQEYLDSESAVLLLAGPAGTGKTTLLRHLICDFGLSAHIVYDEDLMKTDAVFQNFLFEENSDMLIIEDADTILGARENENNTLMARFLSVGDGLIKLPNKKLIFTTNLTDFARIDPALRRPGRCFATTVTRTLNLAEAKAVAKVANLKLPTERHEYTLAELFHNTISPETRKAGFV